MKIFKKMKKRVIREACVIVNRAYREDEVFRDAIIASIASAVGTMPIGNVNKQSKHIADNVFK